MNENVLALIIIALVLCVIWCVIWFIMYKACFYSGDDTSDLGPCGSVQEFERREKKRDNAEREQEHKDLMHELNQLRKQIEKLNKE